MSLNPDDVLIFKLRGFNILQKLKPKSTPKAEQPAPEKIEEAKPVQLETENLMIAETQTTQVMVKKEEAPNPTPQHTRPRSYEEEMRIRNLESLEQMAALYTPSVAEQKRKMEMPVSTFSIITSALFVLNAIVFEYFIHGQSLFVINYINMVGVEAFLLNWNYTYVVAFFNLFIAVMCVISGLLMLTKIKNGYLIAAGTASIMIVGVSQEYLNSDATYLLMMSVLSFITIVALAYTRMSAVRMKEREEIFPFQVDWPRLENF